MRHRSEGGRAVQACRTPVCVCVRDGDSGGQADLLSSAATDVLVCFLFFFFDSLLCSSGTSKRWHTRTHTHTPCACGSESQAMCINQRIRFFSLFSLACAFAASSVFSFSCSAPLARSGARGRRSRTKWDARRSLLSGRPLQSLPLTWSFRHFTSAGAQHLHLPQSRF